MARGLGSSGVAMLMGTRVQKMRTGPSEGGGRLAAVAKILWMWAWQNDVLMLIKKGDGDSPYPHFYKPQNVNVPHDVETMPLLQIF